VVLNYSCRFTSLVDHVHTFGFSVYIKVPCLLIYKYVYNMHSIAGMDPLEFIDILSDSDLGEVTDDDAMVEYVPESDPEEDPGYASENEEPFEYGPEPISDGEDVEVIEVIEVPDDEVLIVLSDDEEVMAIEGPVSNASTGASVPSAAIRAAGLRRYSTDSEDSTAAIPRVFETGGPSNARALGVPNATDDSGPLNLDERFELLGMHIVGLGNRVDDELEKIGERLQELEDSNAAARHFRSITESNMHLAGQRAQRAEEDSANARQRVIDLESRLRSVTHFGGITFPPPQ
jgi:hypothetical protein